MGNRPRDDGFQMKINGQTWQLRLIAYSFIAFLAFMLCGIHLDAMEPKASPSVMIWDDVAFVAALLSLGGVVVGLLGTSAFHSKSKNP